MERIHKIQNHPVFKEQFELLQKAEKDRTFCRHTMEHFLDVARLMYIYHLEEGTELSKELIYGAALLHDIGRYEQITVGTPHHISGARIAGEILLDCGFDAAETARIQEAISSHRKSGTGKEDILASYLYRADKQSRNCFCCTAEKECNWDEEKKNMLIFY